MDKRLLWSIQRSKKIFHQRLLGENILTFMADHEQKSESSISFTSSVVSFFWMIVEYGIEQEKYVTNAIF